MKLFTDSALARNASWMFLGQGFGYGLRVVYFIVIARLLGALQYGIVVGAFAFVSLVAEYSRLGSGTVLLRYVSSDRRRFAAYWGNSLIVTSVMSSVLIVIIHLLAPRVLDKSSSAIVALTAVASCLCEQLTIGATQVFQALQEMRFTAIFNQLTSMLRCLAAILMLLTWHHATALQWASVSVAASATGTVIALATVTIRVGWPAFKLSLLRRHSGEGVEYAFAASTTSAYNDLDKTMLSHFGMSVANGIYGMAYRIVDMASVPVTSLQLAASPRLFQLAEAGAEQSILLGRRLLTQGILMSTVTAFGMFLLAPIIPALAGTSFKDGICALRWLCLIPVFRSIHGISGSVLTAIGLQRHRTLTQLTVVALNFSLNICLIPRYGWTGAAWASLASDGTLGLLNWGAMQRAQKRLMSNEQASPFTLPEQATSSSTYSVPLVSIIIPYFNHPIFVVEAVTSAKQQTYRNIEIIVVDDGSEILAETALQHFSDVCIIRTENGGVSAARNMGFESSSGDFLLFLDSDDRLLPNAIEDHLRLFHTYPDTGLSFGSAQIINVNGKAIGTPHICRPRNNYFSMMLGANPIACPGGTMMRRAAFVGAGKFDVSFKNADDYHLYLRLLRQATFKQHGACVVEYRKHAGGKSGNKPRMLAAVMRVLDELELSCQLTPSELKHLRRGRARWIHTYSPQETLSYRLHSLYYSFYSMLTVSPRYYF